MEEEEIGHYFPEIFKTSADCKYGNCTHRHEPGCAVRKAVEELSLIHIYSSSIFDSSTIFTFSTVFVPTRIFCSLYPIQEKTRVDLAETLIE